MLVEYYELLSKRPHNNRIFARTSSEKGIIMSDLHRELLTAAYNAGLKSYSPYSKFRVGAALRGISGTIYTGCNIENRSYSPTVCAERTAVFKAVSEGETEFTDIAVVGLDCEYPLPPCGVCRQVLTEFGKNTNVIMAGKDLNSYIVKKLSDLMPMDSLADLKSKE